MPNQIFVDICVVGGGSGGLYVAAGASQMGADVALIESGKMGGIVSTTAVYLPRR